MKDETASTLGRFVSKNRFLLLILMVGIALLLLPGGDSADTNDSLTEAEVRLLGALRNLEGVGEAYVLLAQENSRNGDFTGAIVLCQGADHPEVRLKIVEAVAAFTGLGSNRIMVMKMKN